MGPNDMVFHKEGGKITAGAFKINSDFLGYPVAKLYNQQNGGNLNIPSNLLNGLAVPAGLLLLQQTIGGGSSNEHTSQDDVINDSLYDKLLKLASENKVNSKKTKKLSNNRKNRNTKKNKR
jgi:hypothetical protein